MCGYTSLIFGKFSPSPTPSFLFGTLRLLNFIILYNPTVLFNFMRYIPLEETLQRLHLLSHTGDLSIFEKKKNIIKLSILFTSLLGPRLVKYPPYGNLGPYVY